MEKYKWIEGYEDTNLFQVLINILLVSQGARKSTLIEWNNFTPDERKKYETLGKEFISDLGLTTLPDPFSDYRMFVVKDKSIRAPESDEDIGDLLEFECKGHRYFDSDVDRLGAYIYETKTNQAIYAEVCETTKMAKDKLRKVLEEKVQWFDQAMKNLGLDYQFEVRLKDLISKQSLLQNYSDKTFVQSHLEEYAEFLYNEFHEKTKFLKNPKLILERFDVFELIMEMIKNGDIDSLYASIVPLSKEYHSLIQTLYVFESELLRNG